MLAEPLCTLRDCTIEYVNEEGILPPIPGEIYSISELAEFLYVAAARPPHALRMDLPSKFRARIHIGGPLGAIHVAKVYLPRSMPANPPGAWIALPERPRPLSECVSFLTAGSTGEDDICGDRLLPVDEVIQIATSLARYRKLPSTHAWVRHDGKGSCVYVAKARLSSDGEESTSCASAEPFSPNGFLLRDDESYLQAIAASPHDRQLRRIYANWLAALEPRRAELIRVCEAMRDVPVWSDRYWELKTRRNELWENCPLPWLEATGYDGSLYDPIFRDGVPDGWRERWRLIREFTERWQGIDVPDVGGRRVEIGQAEERLGVELPPSLREFIAYVHDVGDSAPRCDPRRYNTLFHSAYYQLCHLHRHLAVSLIHFTLSSTALGVAHEDLYASDPRTYFFDEVLEPDGSSISSTLRPLRSPTFFSPSLSMSIFQNLFIQLPTAGNLEARGADPNDWIPRLAADFPVHARFDDAHIFENNEILVLVSGRGDRTGGHVEHFVDAIVRRPVPLDSVPAYLFGGTGKNIGSAGMLGPEPYRRELEMRLRPPEGRQPPTEERGPDPQRFDMKTYIEWMLYAGRYPLWLSILRRRELERRAENTGGCLAHEQPALSKVPSPERDDNIQF
jgi:uncharacterized protein (TIGR02996 family)